MATPQFTAYNADGSVQFDANLQTYALAFVYQVPVVFFTNFTMSNGQNVAISKIGFGNEYVNFPVTDMDMAAVGMVDGYWYGNAQYEFNQGIDGLNAPFSCWTNQPAGSTANIYVFRETKTQAAPSNFGIQLCDDQGRVTYDAAKYPTRGLGYLQSGQSFNIGSANATAVVQSGLAWRREVTSVGANFKDTYPCAMKNGATISSYPLTFTNSGSGGRPVGVYYDQPQQDIILDVSNIDMSLVGAVPPPPTNAQRYIPGADGNPSVPLRITVGSGNVILTMVSTVTHTSNTNNSTATINANFQARNLSTGAGWGNVGPTQTTTATQQRIPGEPAELTPGNFNFSMNYGVSPGHVMEFRVVYSVTDASKAVQYSATTMRARST